jgi:integrase
VDARNAEGAIERRTYTRIVGAAVGPDAITKRVAERRAWDDVLSKLDQAAVHPGSMLTLAQFVESKFEPEVILYLKPAGKTFYRSMLRKWIVPALGQKQLRAISTDRAQEVIRAVVDAGKTPQTALHARNCLSAVLRHARTLKLISGELATEGVRLPEMRRKERRAPSWDQVVKVAEKLPPPVDLLALLLATTGLRIGEAMGLRWRRVNLSPESIDCDGEVVAPESLFVAENYVLGRYQSLKNASSRRVVPMPGWLVGELRTLKAGRSGEDPVFAGRTGRPLNWGNLENRVLKKAAAIAGLGSVIPPAAEGGKTRYESWVSWHSFRHCSASIADHLGLTVTERQRILGHATSAMTMRYSHADIAQVREKIERIQPGSERVIRIDKRLSKP